MAALRLPPIHLPLHIAPLGLLQLAFAFFVDVGLDKLAATTSGVIPA
jgi:hypothetical protein